MKKKDWLNKLASELPNLSNRTRNAMIWKNCTVGQLLKDFDRLKPLRIGGPPYFNRLGYGAGKKAITELRHSLRGVGFGVKDHILLSDNPNEFNVRGLQDKYGLSRKQAELFTNISLKEGWVSPPLFVE
jgi:hypothetical protein